MRRRDFIAGVGSMAVAWPRAARSQQAGLPLIGIMRSTSADDQTQFLAPFKAGLAQTGFFDGRNVTIDFRSGENDYTRLPGIAAEFVRMGAAMIVATGAVPTAIAAKNATTTIPILFVIGSDPIRWGLVASLGRPGGNVTGFTAYASALIPKRLELLREVFPAASGIGFLVNPSNPNTEPEVEELQALARTGGWTLHTVPASTDAQLESAFAALVRLRASAFLYSSDLFLVSRIAQMVALGFRHRLLAVHGRREAAVAGGLLSYGPRPAETYRAAGTYAGRILKGEKPGDLPVQQPAKFELVVNLRTAKTMGIAMPASILIRADEVIE